MRCDEWNKTKTFRTPGCARKLAGCVLGLLACLMVWGGVGFAQTSSYAYQRVSVLVDKDFSADIKSKIMATNIIQEIGIDNFIGIYVLGVKVNGTRIDYEVTEMGELKQQVGATSQIPGQAQKALVLIVKNKVSDSKILEIVTSNKSIGWDPTIDLIEQFSLEDVQSLLGDSQQMESNVNLSQLVTYLGYLEDARKYLEAGEGEKAGEFLKKGAEISATFPSGYKMLGVEKLIASDVRLRITDWLLPGAVLGGVLVLTFFLFRMTNLLSQVTSKREAGEGAGGEGAGGGGGGMITMAAPATQPVAAGESPTIPGMEEDMRDGDRRNPFGFLRQLDSESIFGVLMGHLSTVRERSIALAHLDHQHASNVLELMFEKGKAEDPKMSEELAKITLEIGRFTELRMEEVNEVAEKIKEPTEKLVARAKEKVNGVKHLAAMIEFMEGHYRQGIMDSLHLDEVLYEEIDSLLIPVEIIILLSDEEFAKLLMMDRTAQNDVLKAICKAEQSVKDAVKRHFNASVFSMRINAFQSEQEFNLMHARQMVLKRLQELSDKGDIDLKKLRGEWKALVAKTAAEQPKA